MELTYSFIIPVYNRPDEIEELLQSMVAITHDKLFEIVIIEDGSTMTSEHIVARFSDQLQISYYYKNNTGPGDSRNFGMKKAKGNFFIILDSDVIMPSNYLEEVHQFLEKDFVHCFGGPDEAHHSFSKLQKAISYSMTSYMTTGGIRGRKKVMNTFQPRSFNMGLSKEAFLASNGFGNIHPGEDPDLVFKLWKLGYRTALIPNAKVFHKRRISWHKFYQQVRKFGLVRPILLHWHPESFKVTYWFPIVFILYTVVSIFIACIGHWIFLASLGVYFMLIFIGCLLKFKSLTIALMSILAVFVQFFGYGTGFLVSYYNIHLLQKVPEQRFKKLFFSK